MFTSRFSRVLTLFTAVPILLRVTNGVNSESMHARSYRANGFLPAVATWYGEPNGAGSGGACGFGNDVTSLAYNGLITAGNQFLFKSGKGCGNCFQVLCTENPSCTKYPITVTVTDECPGSCNNERVHFDLSGKAFGSLAKRGQEWKLRNAGRINIQYQSVPCHYNARITFKIDTGSNGYYLAFAIEYVDGDGDIGSVDIFPSKLRRSFAMQQSWGATWKVGLPEGLRGPFSVKVTTNKTRRTIFAKNAIPANWVPGRYYHG